MKCNGNSTTVRELKESKTRYEKALELYRSGAVSIGEDGYFRVLGFRVDVERVTCDCADYQKYKQPCLHYYAACFFQKKRPSNQDAPNTHTEAPRKDFDSAR
jgi:SWIM zinc finger